MSPLVAFILGAISTAIVIPTVAVLCRRLERARSANASLAENQVTTISQVLHLATQGSPTGVAIIDRSGDVLLSNGPAHNMMIVHDRTVNPEVWTLAQQVFEDKETRCLDITMPKLRTGSRVTNVRAVVQPLTRIDDRFVVIYATDESENVRMESARRDFVANVSHELKTPVGGLSLLAEALLEDSGNQEHVEYFGARIMKESHRMAEMINELIALSKLQGAEALPEMEPVSVDDVITEAMNRNQVAADTNGIELTRGQNYGVQVMGDKALLVTAVSNLISNAINYSPKASPVSLTQKIVNDVIHIRVTDRGMGIAPENHQRVFERFFRVDKARSRATGGTGLGLAIVKHVVANHGGSIKLWSRPGTGSTFTILLPIHWPAPEEDTEEDATEQTRSDAHPLREAVNRVTARRKES